MRDYSRIVGKPEVMQIGMCGSVPTSREVFTNHRFGFGVWKRCGFDPGIPDSPCAQNETLTVGPRSGFLNHLHFYSELFW
jgi:hypothetical protein